MLLIEYVLIVSLLLVVKNEVYASEFMGALKAHVESETAKLQARQQLLYQSLTITKIEGFDLRLFSRAFLRDFELWLFDETKQEERDKICVALDEFLSTFPTEPEHERAFMSDAVGIVKTSSLQRAKEPPPKNPKLLVLLLRACCVDLGATGLRLMNHRLMVLSSELLGNTVYSYISTLHRKNDSQSIRINRLAYF